MALVGGIVFLLVVWLPAVGRAAAARLVLEAATAAGVSFEIGVAGLVLGLTSVLVATQPAATL